MSWVAVAVGVGGAVASGVSASKQAKAQAKAAKEGSKPQHIDKTTTTTSEPWAPTVDPRKYGLDRATELLKGTTYAPAKPAKPGNTALWQQYLAQGGNKAGGADWKAFQAKNAGGGSSVGPKGPAPVTTKDLVNRANTLATTEDPLVTAGKDAVTRQIEDRYGGNELLGETYEKAQGLENPYLSRFADMMLGEMGGGPGGGGGGQPGRNVRYGYQPGTGGAPGSSASGGSQFTVSGNAPVGAAGYIKSQLDEEYGQNPYLDKLLEQAAGKTTEEYQRGLAGLSAGAEGAGMFGASGHQLADALQAQKYAEALSGAETQTRYQDYNDWNARRMQAMGLGTQYDLGAMEDATRRYGIDAQSAAAASGAGANMEEIASRERLAKMGMFLDATGQMQDVSQLGLQGMGGMAQLLQGGKEFGMEAVPGYHDIAMGDLGKAFGMSSAWDEQQNQQQNRNRAFGLQQQEYQRNLPWQDLARYSDLIQGFGGGFGTETTHEVGDIPSNYQAPPPGPDPWAAGLQGGLGAASLAMQWQGNRQQAPPARGGAAGYGNQSASSPTGFSLGGAQQWNPWGPGGTGLGR